MARLLAVVLLLTTMAWAHVGSKDVYETVQAGPYTLYVTVRPPDVIPGIAVVEVRSSGAAVEALRITPLPLTGEASKHPPASDAMKQSSVDKDFYTGAIWIMGAGTWQVRVDVEGAGGAQRVSVPVVAMPVSTLKMGHTMGAVLGVLGLVLLLGMAGIVAASFREARLPPGVEATERSTGVGRRAMWVSVAVMIAIVVLCGKWWDVEAAGYAENIFVSAPAEATVTGSQLDLQIERVPGADNRMPRSNKDYLPDHGHLIHLYAIRWPEMDAAYHLHPEGVGAGHFREALPMMPAGEYRLYGDVVHATGLAETVQARLEVPAGMHGGALGVEDAQAAPAGVSAGVLGAQYKLPDGYVMEWEQPQELSAGKAYTFRFRLLDARGGLATDMQPYLGMAGHAAFVKTDGSVFAHTHPEGTAAMADVMLAGGGMGDGAAVGAEVGFPYGFPTAGAYRVFVQMKHGGVVETGVFDMRVH